MSTMNGTLKIVLFVLVLNINIIKCSLPTFTNWAITHTLNTSMNVGLYGICLLQNKNNDLWMCGGTYKNNDDYLMNVNTCKKYIINQNYIQSYQTHTIQLQSWLPGFHTQINPFSCQTQNQGLFYYYYFFFCMLLVYFLL